MILVFSHTKIVEIVLKITYDDEREVGRRRCKQNEVNNEIYFMLNVFENMQNSYIWDLENSQVIFDQFQLASE